MDLTELVDQINLATSLLSIDHHSDINNTYAQALQNSDRDRLLLAARGLLSALEGPHKTIVEISKGPVGHAALRTALMLKVFEHWASEETKVANELAEHTGAEKLLIIRTMRTLVAIGIFEEIAESTYVHNAVSQTLINPTFRTLIIGMSSTAGLTMAKLPDYLASINFRSPNDPKSALFHYANDTKLDMFQWLRTQPKQLAVFADYNAASMRLEEPYLKHTINALLPKSTFEDGVVGKELAQDVVLLVDVGAGQGQVLREVRKNRPDLVGRMIAQDLPEVIAGRKVVDGVETMAYDFFEPQPVKGASVYFFRHIFHDWPDVSCQQILTNTLSAMTPGQSQLVIVDQVLPSTGVPAISAFMDLTMMTFGGMERTKRQWEELLEGVGLEIVAIEGPKSGSQSLDGTIKALLRA